MFNHIDCRVIQGFPALRKAQTIHVKKIRCFFTCLWYSQSAANTSHAFRATRSGWWMNGEALTILNPWLFVRIFSDYGCLNTEKSVSLTDIDFQSFVEAVEKPKYEEKTESYEFSYFDNGISRGRERISTTGRFATGRFWLCPWKTSSFGKDWLNNWEFCILKITPIVKFVVIQRIFSSWALAQTGVVGLFIFIRRLFLSLKGYCVYMINKILHGCL